MGTTPRDKKLADDAVRTKALAVHPPTPKSPPPSRPSGPPVTGKPDEAPDPNPGLDGFK